MILGSRKCGSLNVLPLPDKGALILSSHPASLPGVSVDEALGLYRQLGASLLVTLITECEMLELGLGSLPDACSLRGVQWWHGAIPDMQAPGQEFDRWWGKQADQLHALLDVGGVVALHCWSGKGRTGTVSARILMERGVPVSEAIRMVRECRAGAIETDEQERYLIGLNTLG